MLAASEMQAALRQLLRQVSALVEDQPQGRNATALPGLWLYRADAPLTNKRSEARMVTLAVILQGRKIVDFGDQRLTYEPGDYLLVTGERRYVSHVELTHPEQPYYSLSLELPPERIAAAVFALVDAGVRFHRDEIEEPAVVAKLEQRLLDTLARLIDSLNDPVATRALAPLAERELLIHLLLSPAGASLRRAAAVDDERIQRARSFLQTHLGEHLTVEEVARHVAMSPSHFAHRFREIVRMSPMQYLKHLRLHHARVLMLGEGLGAAEAGASVGYASPSHFTRDFKSQFGAPPGTYVRRFR
ncbi:AraC family transcriptional regulator [Pseudenhygromyxa sp. WMMC2535]|uniref:AraC family transcriptional regulator n=1 Tax=Pseudenhygromyxa sp. WMMC2535 TaxID=2712867 RepID=UPI001556FEDD|nr:AraC family transcriptional regulator [Pseudenhygromyxa sp. WMMC2535]NVB36355.1 AraC family transcriptional regulator [Pseudenhygromyxa sp. WMMC2535]